MAFVESSGPCRHGVIDDVCWECTAEKLQEEVRQRLTHLRHVTMMTTPVCAICGCSVSLLEAVNEALEHLKK